VVLHVLPHRTAMRRHDAGLFGQLPDSGLQRSLAGVDRSPRDGPCVTVMTPADPMLQQHGITVDEQNTGGPQGAPMPMPQTAHDEPFGDQLAYPGQQLRRATIAPNAELSGKLAEPTSLW
jgi:hypothetical protein